MTTRSEYPAAINDPNGGDCGSVGSFVGDAEGDTEGDTVGGGVGTGTGASTGCRVGGEGSFPIGVPSVSVRFYRKEILRHPCRKNDKEQTRKRTLTWYTTPRVAVHL